MTSKNAKESPTIRRLRHRLQKHLTHQDTLMTQDALAEVSGLIQEALKRKAMSRVNLKSKHIVLLDKNRPPAKEAKATERLRLLIKKDYFLQ